MGRWARGNKLGMLNTRSAPGRPCSVYVGRIRLGRARDPCADANTISGGRWDSLLHRQGLNEATAAGRQGESSSICTSTLLAFTVQRNLSCPPSNVTDVRNDSKHIGGVKLGTLKDKVFDFKNLQYVQLNEVKLVSDDFLLLSTNPNVASCGKQISQSCCFPSNDH